MPEATPKATWKISLEYSSDDGTGPTDVTLSVSGSWTLGEGQRAVDDCVTLDMASVVRMLQESGHLVAPGGAQSVIEAFEDGWG